jgi:hypothetical protein
MPARKDEGDVRKLLEEKGFVWIEEISFYKSNGTPIICKNNKGYFVKLRLSDLLNGLNPRAFDVRNEYSIHNIKEYVKHNQKNLELVSEVYKGESKKLKLRCIIDGNIIEDSWHHIMSRRINCSVCMENERFAKNNISADYVIDKARDNFIIASPNSNFVNLEERVSCYCIKHDFYFKMKCRSIISGSKCPTCRNTTLDTEDVVGRINNVNKNIEVLSGKYINAKNKLDFKCLVCGHIWSALAHSTIYGCGCPECAKLNSEGYYCITRAKKMKDEWIKKECVVYLIRLYDENENFYKVGITKNKINKRFDSKISMPYNYEIIKIIKTNLYDAVHIEAEIKGSSENNKYIPNKYFHGRTECFSKYINIEQAYNCV